MFVHACDLARNFTLPIVTSARRFDGAVGTGMGTFVALNSDGWVATVAHGVSPLAQLQADADEVAAYDAALATIAEDPDPNRRKNKARKLRQSPEWIRNVSIWWANDNATMAELYAYPELDLAVARLEGAGLEPGSIYPTFKNPENMKQGTSLVRIGFPFHEVHSHWDETSERFKLEAGAIPAPLFPIEGIFTREMDGGVSPQGLPIRMVETSSPGLQGQSGGPILDRDGVIWAIQSVTRHWELGFRPTVKVGNKTVEEHQFLNVGMGIHTKSLKAVFERHEIEVEWAD